MLGGARAEADHAEAATASAKAFDIQRLFTQQQAQAIAGMVLGRLTLSMRDIASGRLVAPFDLMVPAQAGFYFCCLPERLSEPKIRAFRDFLFSEIAAERGILDDFRLRKSQG